MLQSPKEGQKASDIWSLGLLYWYILTGETPYAELTSENFVAAVCDSGARPSSLLSSSGAQGRFSGVREETHSQILAQLQKDVIDACLLVDPLARVSSGELVRRLEILIHKSIDEMPTYASDLWTSFEAKKAVERFSLLSTAFLDHVRVEFDSLGDVLAGYDVEKIIQCLMICLNGEKELNEWISFSNFATFFHIFSHVGTGNFGDSLRYFMQCIKLPYFFGRFTGVEGLQLEPNQFFVYYGVEPVLEARLLIHLKKADGHDLDIPIFKFDGSLDVTVDNETTFAARLETLVKAALLQAYAVTSVPSPFAQALETISTK